MVTTMWINNSGIKNCRDAAVNGMKCCAVHDIKILVVLTVAMFDVLICLIADNT